MAKITDWFGNATPLDTIGPLTINDAGGVRKLLFDGGDHEVGSRYVDTSSRQYEFHSVSLREGKITFGPTSSGKLMLLRVKLSSVALDFLDAKNLLIEFHDCELRGVSISGAQRLKFQSCTHLQLPAGVFDAVSATSCPNVEGMNPHGDCQTSKLTINGQKSAETLFESAKVGFVDMQSLHIEDAKCVGVEVGGKIENVYLKASRFSGCRFTCNSQAWTEEATVHTNDDGSGAWIPEVTEALRLTRVRFVDVLVNTEVIANVCDDRSSVDLHRAIVDDKWEKLRDNYTGTMMILHATLLVGFFLPLAARLAMLVGLGHATSATASIIPENSTIIWHTLYVGEVLLYGFQGSHSIGGYVQAVLTILLFTYNGIRLYLTVSVSKLRAREEHMSEQGFSRVRPSRKRYSQLARLHRVMGFLLIIAVVSGLWKFLSALLVRIQIPSW